MTLDEKRKWLVSCREEASKLYEEERKLRERQRALHEKSNELEREIAAEMSPIKPGDTIEWDGGKRGVVLWVYQERMSDPKKLNFSYKVQRYFKNGKPAKEELAEYFYNPRLIQPINTPLK